MPKTALAILLLCSTIYAQDRMTPQLALARICASEEGLARITDGCAAIHQVLLRGARRTGLSYVAFAHAYSSSVFDGDGQRPWLAGLMPDGRQPERWPAQVTVRVGDHIEVRPGPSWARYREPWLWLYEHAGLVLRGEIPSFCIIPPDHWGGMRLETDRANAERHIRNGEWEEAPCGDTRNTFFHIIRPAPAPPVIERSAAEPLVAAL